MKKRKVLIFTTLVAVVTLVVCAMTFFPTLHFNVTPYFDLFKDVQSSSGSNDSLLQDKMFHNAAMKDSRKVTSHKPTPSYELKFLSALPKPLPTTSSSTIPTAKQPPPQSTTSSSSTLPPTIPLPSQQKASSSSTTTKPLPTTSSTTLTTMTPPRTSKTRTTSQASTLDKTLLRSITTSLLTIRETNPTQKMSPHTTTSNFSSSKPFLPCNWTVEKIPQAWRYQAYLHCNETSTDIILRKVPNDITPAVLGSGSKVMMSCLRRIIRSRLCTDAGLRVPKVAHYIWFGERNMTLVTFTSVLSAVRFLRPCLVLFHGDSLPDGPYWRALLQLVPSIVHVPRTPPREIYGHNVSVVEHKADIARLQILIEYGGVYNDIDQYLLHPVDDLRNESAVIGIEVPDVKCGNGLLFSEPDAPFIHLWLSKYVTFNDSIWGDHSTYLPFNLSRVVPPGWVKVVNTFFTPNYFHMWPLYTNRDYDWHAHYALHLYARIYKKFIEEEMGQLRLDKQSSTIGDMTRHILFGSRNACYVET